MAEVTLPEGWSSFETGCVSCPEDSIPSSGQVLEVLHCYQFAGGVPDGTLPGNSSGAMNFVTGEFDQESFIAVVSNQTGFSVGYPTSGSIQVLLATGETLTAVDEILLTDGATGNFVGQSAGTGRQGHTDDRAVLFSITDLTPQDGGQGTVLAYFNYDSDTVKYFHFSGGTTAGTWAKRGSRLWHARVGPIGFDRYDTSTGGAAITNGDLSGVVADSGYMRALHASDNFLYLLVRGGGASVIYRLDLDTMAVIDSWNIFASAPVALNMYVVNDDLIYIWNETGDSTTWGFFYLRTTTSIVTLIDLVVKDCTTSIFDNAGQLGMQYNKGKFFLTYGGFGTGIPNITVIGTLTCTELGTPFGVDP